jgi:hypothetical protein
MTPPTPASTKVETWIFTRRARGTNDEGGEGAPQRCLHGVEVHPRMPSSPAKTEVVARLSPGAHRTQSRRRLSAKLAVVEQTLQHAATHHHHHCGRAHRSTSRRVASRQTRSRRSSDEKARTPGAAAPASSSLAGTTSPEKQTGRHQPPAGGAAPTNCPEHRLGSASIDRGPPGPGRAQIGSARSRQPQRPPTALAALSRRPARLQQHRHAHLLLLDSPSTSSPPEPIGPRASPDALAAPHRAAGAGPSAPRSPPRCRTAPATSVASPGHRAAAPHASAPPPLDAASPRHPPPSGVRESPAAADADRASPVSAPWRRRGEGRGELGPCPAARVSPRSLAGATREGRTGSSWEQSC